jgi:hypothetical protein
MLHTQGEHLRAHSGATRALALAHAAGDLEMIAQAEHLLGYVEYALGKLNAARDHFTHSVERFRILAIPWGTGYSLTGLAAVALATGDAGEAERLLDEAASVLRRAGPWFMSLGRYMRAVLAVRRGNPDQAIRLVRESLTPIRALHDAFAFVYTLVPLAAAVARKGDHVWAARILGSRDAVIERTGITIVDPSVHDIREEAEREARACLGADRWARAYAAGRTVSIDALLKDIDDAVDAAAQTLYDVGRREQ